MNNSRARVAALALFLTTGAWATNRPELVPQQQSQSQGQSQFQGQTQGSQSLTDSDRSSYRSWAVVLPVAPWMPPMQKVECTLAQVRQTDEMVGWGAWRRAEASTDTSDCTVIALRNAKVETCQYASAKQVEDLLLVKHLPAFSAADSSGYIDLTPTQCAALKAPPLPQLPVSLVQVPQPEPRACVPRPKHDHKKRAVKRIDCK